MTGSAVGRVQIDGQDTGSGFAITGGCALTAGHVVRPVTDKMLSSQQLSAGEPPEPTVVCVLDRGQPGPVPAVVQYQPDGAEPILVTRVEVSTSLDVAVLHLQRPPPAVLPVGPATAGAEWQVETRPRASDPALTGTVTNPHRQLQNQRGIETTLIQLWVREQLGDYQGYSGSPVTSPSTSEMPSWVLGVLVEQGRWRINPQLGQPAPVANVLFAAPIDQVLTEFGLTGVTPAEPVQRIPLPVPFEVRRPQQLNRVIDALLANPSQPRPDGQLVGLVGMGGSGKSVLAAATARDRRVRDAFPDGRFWLELGPHPPLLQLQARLAAALGDSTPITDVPQGRAQLSRLLAERRCLLVLDNVWNRTDLSAFAVVGSTGGTLVTTRDAATLAGNTGISLDELAPTAALQLLAGWTATPPGQLPTEAEQVAQECGYLPLALALCGAMIATGSHSWPELLDLLRHADLEALHSRLVDYRHPSLAVALTASIDTLPQDARDRYVQLAVFDAKGPVPEAVLQLLWGLDQQDTTAFVDGLAAKSLLRVEADRVSLHDVQMDYLVRCAAANLPALHDRLLTAYRGQCHGSWAGGPDDGYFRQHLARHLYCADRLPELQALLLDLDWMNAKLTTGTVPGLLADYDSLPLDPVLRQVAGALMLSAHVLAHDPGQLPSQLMGRLGHQHDPQLRDLLQRAHRWPATPWLRPMTASLTPPGGPLLHTLTGHTNSVHAVAVSADGRRAVSNGGGTVQVWDLDTGVAVHTLTSYDTGSERAVHAVAVSADGRRAMAGSQNGTVQVWDLDSGALLHTMAPQHGSVRAVAVSADGRRAVSGTEDGTVRVWDLDSGTPVRTLAGEHGSLWAVAVSADGRRAVVGSGDGTMEVWDLDSGALLRTLASQHRSIVGAVAVSADGRRAASMGGVFDKTVRVWDLVTGALLHTLTAHDSSVEAVAVSQDGHRMVSSDSAGTMRVWDLDWGVLLRTLTAHDGPVGAVAVSADGRRAVSGASDGTVRVWDLAAGEPSHALTAHDSSVEAVAVSADGHRAVSGGKDGTVRVWHLESGALLRTLTAHDGPVGAVAVSADGRRAVSGANDGTVRVWDLAAGEPSHALTAHDGRVAAVGVTADGRRGVSGGEDGTVRVWDLESGALLHILTGHRHSPVRAVAVTADGRRAVAAGEDATVGIWDLSTGKKAAPASRWLRRLFAQRLWLSTMFLSVSADGRRAVSSGPDGAVRVWDLRSGALLHTIAAKGGAAAVAVSADGRRAVSGGHLWGEVRVWDLDSGALLHTMAGHHGGVEAVAVSADGRCGVSGGEDRTVRVWDLVPGLELTSFVSDSRITALAATPPSTRVIVGTSTGPVHLLELCLWK